MAAQLGEGFEVIVDALSGRTTCIDDPEAVIGGAGLNGASYLAAAWAAIFHSTW